MGSVRIPSLEVRVPLQATSFRQESPVFPIARQSSPGHQRCHPDSSTLSKNSFESFNEIDASELKRRHFDFDESDTDDQAARQAQQPTKSAQTKEASPLPGPQVSVTPEHQDHNFTGAGHPGATGTFPQPYPKDRLLHIPMESHACHRKAARSEPRCSRNRRRRNAKARAQRLRDRSFRSASVPIKAPTTLSVDNLSFLSNELKPKRKHCAFVQEQELKWLFEDRVGTPHLSELEPGDAVNAQLNVDELSVGGEVAALSIGDGATQGLSTFVITDIPNKEPSPD
jgi:hypothetical protein